MARVSAVDPIDYLVQRKFPRQATEVSAMALRYPEPRNALSPPSRHHLAQVLMEHSVIHAGHSGASWVESVWQERYEKNHNSRSHW